MQILKKLSLWGVKEVKGSYHSLRSLEVKAISIVSLRFHKKLFSKAGSSPHKKPQLRCWRRPLMVRQPYSEAVQSTVSVPYKGNRRGRKDY